MNETKTNKLPLHKKAAFDYFNKLTINKTARTGDEYHLLNETELKKINAVYKNTLLKAAVTGAISVLAYYLPIYAFPDFFYSFNQDLTLFGRETEVNFLTLSMTLFFILLEIFILTKLNLRAVADIANACGFPDKKDSHHDLHLEQLFNVGLDSKNKETLKFGIDPYDGIPKFYIMLFTLLNLVKAGLTNLIVKMILVKISARAGIRAYADLVGVPVFAIWNAIASERIIRTAKVYIMAPRVIHQLTEEIKYLKKDESFKQNIFDAMQFVVGLKRSFHHNHYLLVEKLISVFELQQFKDAETDKVAFLNKIKNSDNQIKMAYSKLIAMGMFIDGSISFKEERVLEKLFDQNIINLNPIAIKKWSRQFRSGKGLDDFIKYQEPT